MISPHDTFTSSFRRNSRGVTLFELLIVLAITSVLLALAAPSFRSIGNSIKLASMSNSLVAHLQLARSEAIKRNGRVVMCKSPDGAHCTSTGGWERGWIVFQDTNNNSDMDGDEAIIQRIDAMPEGWRMAGNQSVAKYVSYMPTGETEMTTGAFQAGTITVCQQSAEKTEARQIVINAVGRPRVQKATVPACA
jgi:type IV fimbrial biogenesis protein FimT